MKFSIIKVSSVNVIKSAENCGFGHISWRNELFKKTTTVYSAIVEKRIKKKKKTTTSYKYNTPIILLIKNTSLFTDIECKLLKSLKF